MGLDRLCAKSDGSYEYGACVFYWILYSMACLIPVITIDARST
jgi:hypothetical protein